MPQSNIYMAPSHPHMIRPSPSSSAAFVDTFTAGTDYVKNLVYGLDSQKLLPVCAFAATLGLGTAALYYGQETRSNPDPDDPSASEPASYKQSKKKTKKRNRRSSRVVFQNPIENDSFTGDIIDEDDSSEALRVEAEDKPEIAQDIKTAETEKTPGTDANNNETEANAATIPELQIQENVIVLKQVPRGRKTPCIAPFPLKLETFLRVHKLKYELDFNNNQPRLCGSPWIRFNKEDIFNSHTVLEFLMDQYDLKVEKELTVEERSLAVAFNSMLENHVYWGIAIWRWVYDGARSLKDIQLLPKETQKLIPDVCKTVEQGAWFHGIGKMSPEEVKHAVLRDLQALSDFLGNKDYFFNTSIPTEVDCTALGMLSQFLWNMHGPFHEAMVSKHRNLRDFCWKIRLKYWPEWEECLNNEKFYSNDPYPTADSFTYPY